MLISQLPDVLLLWINLLFSQKADVKHFHMSLEWFQRWLQSANKGLIERVLLNLDLLLRYLYLWAFLSTRHFLKCVYFTDLWENVNQSENSIFPLANHEILYKTHFCPFWVIFLVLIFFNAILLIFQFLHFSFFWLSFNSVSFSISQIMTCDMWHVTWDMWKFLPGFMY